MLSLAVDVTLLILLLREYVTASAMSFGLPAGQASGRDLAAWDETGPGALHSYSDPIVTVCRFSKSCI